MLTVVFWRVERFRSGTLTGWLGVNSGPGLIACMLVVEELFIGCIV